MSKTQKDLLSSLLFLGLGIMVLVSVPLTIKDPGVTGVGPRAFPNFIGACFVLLSLVLLLQTVLKVRRTRQEQADTAEAADAAPSLQMRVQTRADELRVAATAAIMLLYALLFERLGYFLSTGLMITGLLVLFKTRKWHYYLISYGIAAAIWLGFTYLLSVQLP